MTAKDALNITTNNLDRERALNRHIENLEAKITRFAELGRRDCIVEFYSYRPGGGYNFEVEIKEYFTNNGFTFKRITDDVCGGVRQAPYWIICW